MSDPKSPPQPPIAIRVSRPYETEDEFLAKELDTLTRTSVVLLGAQSRPQGVVLRFEVVLASGAPLVRGEGRVTAFKENVLDGMAGLTLRFTRLDSKSKALVDRAAALRDARGRPSMLPATEPRSPLPPIAAPSSPAISSSGPSSGPASGGPPSSGGLRSPTRPPIRPSVRPSPSSVRPAARPPLLPAEPVLTLDLDARGGEIPAPKSRTAPPPPPRAPTAAAVPATPAASAFPPPDLFPADLTVDSASSDPLVELVPNGPSSVPPSVSPSVPPSAEAISAAPMPLSPPPASSPSVPEAEPSTPLDLEATRAEAPRSKSQRPGRPPPLPAEPHVAARAVASPDREEKLERLRARARALRPEDVTDILEQKRRPTRST